MPGKQRSETSSWAREPHAFNRMDLKSIARKDRFDYWREMFGGTFIDRDRAERASDFDGVMLTGAEPTGIGFANLRSDALICTYGKTDSPIVMLGFLKQGTVKFRNARDETAVLEGGGGLVLFDCDRPATASVSRNDMSYLALPRALVTSALGGDPVPRGQLLRTLPHRGLAPILQAYLEAMSVHGGTLAPIESRAAIQSATALALSLLARLNPQGMADSEAMDDALFTAARKYMAANLGQHTLTADHIAAGVGCSRARLYRIFAQKDQAVAACLWEIRMTHASLLLKTLPSEPIASIAFHCGYTDLSAFGKAFKRRFGLPPSDWRQQQKEGPVLDAVPAE